MDIKDLYEGFRAGHRELAEATDHRHQEFWETAEASGGRETGASYLWFETLATQLNVWMREREKHAEIARVFAYFDLKFRQGNDEVRNWIDVGLVENLFWRVPPQNAAPVWDCMPASLKGLYVAFHQGPPALEE